MLCSHIILSTSSIPLLFPIPYILSMPIRAHLMFSRWETSNDLLLYPLILLDLFWMKALVVCMANDLFRGHHSF